MRTASATCGTCGHPAIGRTTISARLWDDLAGEDGPAAYQAMWALSEMPDRRVAMLAEKLRPVKTVIDLDRVDRGNPNEEIQRLRRMKTLLIEKDPKVESAVAVRRAISLLAQLGTPDAIGLLNNLAEHDPKRDVGRFATAAHESTENKTVGQASA